MKEVTEANTQSSSEETEQQLVVEPPTKKQKMSNNEEDAKQIRNLLQTFRETSNDYGFGSGSGSKMCTYFFYALIGNSKRAIATIIGRAE